MKLSKDLTKQQRGRLTPQTRAVVTSLKRRANLIRREVREVLTILPPIVFSACPACDGSFTTSFDLNEVTSLTRTSNEFLKVARKAIEERLKVGGRSRPCDQACVARVKARREAAREDLELARELAKVTERVIRGTPRINIF